jgi:hypothetical protein
MMSDTKRKSVSAKIKTTYGVLIKLFEDAADLGMVFDMQVDLYGPMNSLEHSLSLAYDAPKPERKTYLSESS